MVPSIFIGHLSSKRIELWARELEQKRIVAGGNDTGHFFKLLSAYYHCTMGHIMAIRVVEFSNRGYKLGKIFA